MKPFDVEQAKTEIRERAKALVDANREEIDRVAEATIRRMEAEAGAFKDLKSETLGSLFRDAAHVIVDEINTKTIPFGDHTGFVLSNSGLRMFLQGIGEVSIGANRGPRNVSLPSHCRVLVFFMPVEE